MLDSNYDYYHIDTVANNNNEVMFFKSTILQWSLLDLYQKLWYLRIIIIMIRSAGYQFLYFFVQIGRV